MGLEFFAGKGLRLLLCCYSACASLIGVQPSHHPMVPAADRHDLDLLLADSYLPVQSIQREVTTLSGVVLCCAPKELNNVELTVVFGQEEAKVAGCFHNGHYLALLLEKIWLISQQSLCTAGFTLAGAPKCPFRLLAFSPETFFP